MSELYECVPNVSIGRDKTLITSVVSKLCQSPGVKILDVDSGYDADRTVITMIGELSAVIDAARQLYHLVIPILDIRQYHGNHPTIGSVDVCPIVRLSSSDQITMCAREEALEAACLLARTVASEFSMPVFMYSLSAQHEDRINLASIRKGGWRELGQRISSFKPDYGPAALHPTAGATIIGVRPLMIAFNVDLATGDVSVAQSIARNLRKEREERGVRYYSVLGWMQESRGVAQVSFNLYDYPHFGMFEAFRAVEHHASSLGVKVTSSELVGLAPQKAFIDAGAKFVLSLGGKYTLIPAQDLINIACQELFLPDAAHDKIIELRLKRVEQFSSLQNEGSGSCEN